MRGFFNGVVTKIKSEYASHLIDIGGCSLHQISNAVKNSLSELYLCNDLEDFLQDISAFFSFHVEFCEPFSHIQEVFSLEKHQLLRYCEIRFLSIYPVVERSIEQYKAIKKLFLDDIPKYHKKVAKQARVIRIRNALKNKYTLPTLYFILNALQIFQKYEKLFQKSETTIHLLYDKQIDLLRTTLLYFCPLDKIEKLKDADSLISYEYNNPAKPENILPLNDFTIGRDAKKIVFDFSEREQTVFMHGVKRFLVKLCDELKKNLPLKNKFLANLRFLQPEYRNIEGEKMILGCAKRMPPIFKLSSREMDALSMEWKHLVLEEIPEVPKVNNHIPVQEYWKAISEINEAGEQKFPIIEKVVKFTSSIAEANADVERLFSQIFHIINEKRNRLGTDALRGLLITKSYIQTIGSCLNFKIDESMMANIEASHSRYAERQDSSGNSKESCIHKRVLEDANEAFKGSKKLKKIELKKIKIEEQEKAIRKKHDKAKLLIDQISSLMDETQSMSTFLTSEKVSLDMAEKKIQKTIIKSSCQKAIKNSLSSVDINNNPSDSDNS